VRGAVREAEIGDDDAPLGVEKDVAGFDVAVDDRAVVELTDAFADGRHHDQDFASVSLPQRARICASVGPSTYCITRYGTFWPVHRPAGGMDHVQAGVLRGGGGAGRLRESREAGIVRRRHRAGRNFTATGGPAAHRAPARPRPCRRGPARRSRRTEPTRAGRSRSTTAPGVGHADQAIVIVSCAVATLDKRTEGGASQANESPCLVNDVEPAKLRKTHADERDHEPPMLTMVTHSDQDPTEPHRRRLGDGLRRLAGHRAALLGVLAQEFLARAALPETARCATSPGLHQVLDDRA